MTYYSSYFIYEKIILIFGNVALEKIEYKEALL